MKLTPPVPRLLAVFAAALALPAAAQDHAAVAGILAGTVEDFSVQGQEARAVLEGIGSAYRFPSSLSPMSRGP